MPKMTGTGIKLEGVRIQRTVIEPASAYVSRTGYLLRHHIGASNVGGVALVRGRKAVGKIYFDIERFFLKRMGERAVELDE